MRGLRLRVNSSDELTLTCSPLTPKFVINKFISDNSDWIIKNTAKFQPKIKIKNLNHLSILGVDYQIIKNITPRDSVIISTSEQKIYLNTVSDSETHIKDILEKRLRRLALNLIKTELANLSQKFHFEFCRVCVKNQCSRYGSCSSLGNLNFNWQIILFPFDKFQHILLHELNHLKIKNHQAEFWYQLSVYDPHCRSNNLWLKKAGRQLLIFS